MKSRAIQVYEVPARNASIEPFTLVKRINSSHANPINFLSWSDDSRFLFSSSDDNSVHINAVFSLKGYATKNLVGHRSKVKAVFQQKDFVCSIGSDGFLYLWKLVPDDKKTDGKSPGNFEHFKAGKQLGLGKRPQQEGDLGEEDLDYADGQDDEPEFIDKSTASHYSEFERQMLESKFILETKK